MGAYRWEVEWCQVLPRFEDGSCDVDRAEYSRQDFDDHDAAITFAKSVIGKDQFGSVRVTPFHMEPYEPGLPASFREYDGDPEYVEEVRS